MNANHTFFLYSNDSTWQTILGWESSQPDSVIYHEDIGVPQVVIYNPHCVDDEVDFDYIQNKYLLTVQTHINNETQIPYHKSLTSAEYSDFLARAKKEGQLPYDVNGDAL